MNTVPKRESSVESVADAGHARGSVGSATFPDLTDEQVKDAISQLLVPGSWKDPRTGALYRFIEHARKFSIELVSARGVESYTEHTESWRLGALRWGVKKIDQNATIDTSRCFGAWAENPFTGEKVNTRVTPKPDEHFIRATTFGNDLYETAVFVSFDPDIFHCECDAWVQIGETCPKCGYREYDGPDSRDDS